MADKQNKHINPHNTITVMLLGQFPKKQIESYSIDSYQINVSVPLIKALVGRTFKVVDYKIDYKKPENSIDLIIEEIK